MSVASVPSPALKKPTPCFKPSSPLRDYHHLLIYLPASSLLPFQFILLTVDKLVFLKHRPGRVTRSKNSSGYLLPSVKQNPLSSAFKGLYGLFIAHYTMVPSCTHQPSQTGSYCSYLLHRLFPMPGMHSLFTSASKNLPISFKTKLKRHMLFPHQITLYFLCTYFYVYMLFRLVEHKLIEGKGSFILFACPQDPSSWHKNRH